MTNPEIFVAHRLLMMRFCEIIRTLASAYKIIDDEKYVKQVLSHLNAWFVDSEKLMDHSLL